MKIKEIESNEELLFNGHVISVYLSDNKIKLKYIRKHSKESKQFQPPTKEAVMDYFFEKGYESMTGLKFWEYYEAANWKDGKGQAVKNWKQKAIGVWFTEQNKRVIKTEDAKPQMVR